MANYILNHVMIGGKPMAQYVMKQAGGNVRAETTLEKARWMLENDRDKVPHISDEIAGYPLTADGIYFFDGRIASADAEAPAADVEIGADGLPIPATAEKPKAKKSTRRVKDVVCE